MTHLLQNSAICLNYKRMVNNKNDKTVLSKVSLKSLPIELIKADYCKKVKEDMNPHFKIIIFLFLLF